MSEPTSTARGLVGHRLAWRRALSRAAPPVGLEPTTCGLEGGRKPAHCAWPQEFACACVRLREARSDELGTRREHERHVQHASWLCVKTARRHPPEVEGLGGFPVEVPWGAS